MVRDCNYILWLALLSNSFIFGIIKPKQLFPFLFHNYEKMFVWLHLK